MTRQRGKHFGVRDVLQIVVVACDESVVERGWDENAGRKIGGFENGETVASSEGGRVDESQEIRIELLSMTPGVGKVLA